MDDVVDIKHLVKTYDKQKALSDITFSVRSGTCFGLLGPNGAGKSTTMKILTGIVEADGGTVEYVPQAITLYEKLSARDNLTFFGEMYGLHGKPLKRRVSEVLELVGLGNKAKEAVQTFSGGMKRRINIAAAILNTGTD